jgi:hypothetical protein
MEPTDHSLFRPTLAIEATEFNVKDLHCGDVVGSSKKRSSIALAGGLARSFEYLYTPAESFFSAHCCWISL